MRDPYDVLGVPKRASEADIKKAFRALAKKMHPDATGARDAASMKKFQEITAAYELLSDPQKRAAFDRGEIDANGQPRVYAGGPFDAAGPGAQDFAFRFNQGGQGAGDDRSRFEGLFGDVFGGAFSRQSKRGSKGADITFTLDVPFEEAVLGGTTRVQLPSGRQLNVKIPAGIESGQSIRLKGQGEAPRGPGEPGDAIATVAVGRHVHFRREGRTIRLDVPITLQEAVLGAKIEVPTLHGPVAMTIPPNTSSGTQFRLKGKGVAASGDAPAGDQFVSVMIVLPDTADVQLEAFARRWQPAKGYEPRAKFKS